MTGGRPWSIAFDPRAFDSLASDLIFVPAAPSRPAVENAALQAVRNIASGHLNGKRLGQRTQTGDLTGLLRVPFDVDQRTDDYRFRVVYDLATSTEGATTVRVLAIGPRINFLVYQAASRNQQKGPP